MPSPRRLFMTKVQATREQRFPLSGRFVRRSTNKTLALAISRLKSSVRSTLSRSAAHLSAELPSGGVPADGWPAWREAHWASVAPGAVVQVGSGGDRRYTFGSRGDVAQLGEHCVRIAGVRGSSPLISTIPSGKRTSGGTFGTPSMDSSSCSAAMITIRVSIASIRPWAVSARNFPSSKAAKYRLRRCSRSARSAPTAVARGTSPFRERAAAVRIGECCLVPASRARRT